MIRVRQKHFLFVLLLAMLFLRSNAAEAHRDYLIKETILQTAHGKITVEKHFGDGILSADPVSVQVRNARGEVVAQTPVSHYIGVLCPSLEFCLAIPHGSLAIWAHPLKLSPKDIDWKKASKATSSRSKELAEYLDKDARRRTIADGEYLSHEREKKGFEEADTIYLLWSPLLIIACYLPLLLFMLLMGAAPYLILVPSNEKFPHWTAKIIIFGVSCGYTIVLLALLIGTLFQFMTPVFYMVLFFALGLHFSRRRYMDRKSLQVKRPNGSEK